MTYQPSSKRSAILLCALSAVATGCVTHAVPIRAPDRATMLETACASGEAWGCANLGYEAEQAGDVERASRHYARGCELGSAWACDELGECLLQFAHSEERLARAIALFRYACDAGQDTACFHLGRMLSDGYPDEARRLFRDACEHGVEQACRPERFFADLPPSSSDEPPDVDRLVEACSDDVPNRCTNAFHRMYDGHTMAASVDGARLLGPDGGSTYLAGCVDPTTTALAGSRFTSLRARLSTCVEATYRLADGEGLSAEGLASYRRLEPVFSGLCRDYVGNGAACAVAGALSLQREADSDDALVLLGRACDGFSGFCATASLGYASAHGTPADRFVHLVAACNTQTSERACRSALALIRDGEVVVADPDQIACRLHDDAACLRLCIEDVDTSACQFVARAIEDGRADPAVDDVRTVAARLWDACGRGSAACLDYVGLSLRLPGEDRDSATFDDAIRLGCVEGFGMQVDRCIGAVGDVAAAYVTLDAATELGVYDRACLFRSEHCSAYITRAQATCRIDAVAACHSFFEDLDTAEARAPYLTATLDACDDGDSDACRIHGRWLQIGRPGSAALDAFARALRPHVMSGAEIVNCDLATTLVATYRMSSTTRSRTSEAARFIAAFERDCAARDADDGEDTYDDGESEDP